MCTSAPTPFYWSGSSTSTSRRNISPSAFTWMGSGRTMTRPSAGTGSTTWRCVPSRPRSNEAIGLPPIRPCSAMRTPLRVRSFFDEMMVLGVEGMMISPGYSYTKAPDQEHFLRREKTHTLFADILSNRKRSWRFNQSPLFLEFLMGKLDYQCTPWGNPTYNIFGWQKPCYLLQDGYVKTFLELLDDTDWDRYGTGRNEKCADCMVHCGYEASAVADTFGSWRGFGRTVWAMLAPNTRWRKRAPSILHV